jgi:hypothetical protein
MQEDQLLSILILQEDHSQHAIEVMDVGSQQAFIVPLGEL